MIQAKRGSILNRFLSLYGRRFASVEGAVPEPRNSYHFRPLEGEVALVFEEGYNSGNKDFHYSSLIIQSLMGGGGFALEADVISILRSITPSLDPSRHKGQAASKRLSRLEGIIPTLETSHALTYLEKLYPTVPDGSKVVLNCSGKADKDVQTSIKQLKL